MLNKLEPSSTTECTGSIPTADAKLTLLKLCVSSMLLTTESKPVCILNELKLLLTLMLATTLVNTNGGLTWLMACLSHTIHQKLTELAVLTMLLNLHS